MTNEQAKWLEDHPEFVVLGMGAVAYDRHVLAPDGTISRTRGEPAPLPVRANKPNAFEVGRPGRPPSGWKAPGRPGKAAGELSPGPAGGSGPRHGGHRNIDGVPRRGVQAQSPPSTSPREAEQAPADPRGYVHDWNQGGGRNSDGEPLKAKDQGPMRKD